MTSLTINILIFALLLLRFTRGEVLTKLFKIIKSTSLYFNITYIFIFTKDTPTLFPAEPFDSAADANKLHDALNAFIADDQAVIDVLCERVAFQRANITQVYNDSNRRVKDIEL